MEDQPEIEVPQSLTQKWQQEQQERAMAEDSKLRLQRREMLILNGVVLVADKRMKPGQTLAISFDVWVHHPVDTEVMIKQIEDHGFYARQPSRAEARNIFKLTEKKLGKIVKVLQDQHNSRMKKFFKSNPEVARDIAHVIKDGTIESGYLG